MPAISEWIKQATVQLVDVGIESAKLDVEIILAHTLRKNRPYLHAHGDALLEERELEIANARLELRLERTPIAYIIGHKEFYGRQFKVTPATLIPRPESEAIIEILMSTVSKNQSPFSSATTRLVDVGTGSGCLGITAKLEVPELEVTLIDISRHALTVAEANAKHLRADVVLLQSDLLSQYPLQAHYIIANLPYVDPAWERSPETDYEPGQALFAPNNGLALIRKLIPQAASRLVSGGYLVLEADPRQHNAITDIAIAQGFIPTQTRDFILCFTLNN